MKILIIGGKKFVGKHIVENALERGYKITLFNRGKTNCDLFPEVENITGDRDGGLAVLGDRKWDAVIDTCGYVPRIVKQSVEFLKGRAGRYVFISTVSVYKDFSVKGITEDYTVGKLKDQTEEINNETYGPLKALCEKEVLEGFGENSLIIRPGLIVGPDDPTDRFSYWPWRVAKGGTILCPGNPDACTQIIDVRDLASWTIRMLESKNNGVYNAVGPDYPLSFRSLLDECKSVSGSEAEFVWVDEKFLLENKIVPFAEMPLWLPDSEEYRFIEYIDNTKALRDGLSFLPLNETIKTTIDFTKDRETLKTGIPPERERELLDKI